MTGWLAVAVPLLSASLGAIVGGLLVHRLTLQREALGARRTQRVDFLLSAYRRLIRASNRDILTREHRDDLEAALSDIMLLGGQAEIDAASAFMVEFAEKKEGELEPVIFALRKSLRDEIGLNDVPMPRPYNLRLHRGGEKSG